MNGPILRFLSEDHARLDALLARSSPRSGEILSGEFAAFRSGLLRHIAMEERVLFPLVLRMQGDRLQPTAAHLRLDHAALAALLVPPPEPLIVNALRGILAVHNAIEESAGGFYEVCDQIVGQQADELLEKLRTFPAVPLLPHAAGPAVLKATRRALARAGYNLDSYGTDVT